MAVVMMVKQRMRGHSMVVDPNGEIIAEADENETVMTVTLDLQKVDTQRRAIPVFENMRPSVYRYAQKEI